VANCCKSSQNLLAILSYCQTQRRTAYLNFCSDHTLKLKVLGLKILASTTSLMLSDSNLFIERSRSVMSARLKSVAKWQKLLFYQLKLMANLASRLLYCRTFMGFTMLVALHGGGLTMHILYYRLTSLSLLWSLLSIMSLYAESCLRSHQNLWNGCNCWGKNLQFTVLWSCVCNLN